MSGAADKLIRAAARRLREAIAASITPSLGTLTLGLRTSTGREVPLLVQELANGEVLLSDAGETWSELVVTGHVHVQPTRGQAKQLARLASLYAIGWDPTAHAFEARCTLETLPDVAARVTAASIALDGWRVLHEQPEAVRVARRPHVADLWKRVATSARELGWQAEEHASMAGSTGFSWPTAVILRRGNARVGVREAVSATAIAMEQAVGCAADTKNPIVLVTRDDRHGDVSTDDLTTRGARVEVIRGLAKVKPREVVEAASRLIDRVAVRA